MKEVEKFRSELKGLTTAQLRELKQRLGERSAILIEELRALEEHMILRGLIESPRTHFFV